MPAILNVADVIKIGIIAFVVIYFANKSLKSAGLDQYAVA